MSRPSPSQPSQPSCSKCNRVLDPRTDEVWFLRGKGYCKEDWKAVQKEREEEMKTAQYLPQKKKGEEMPPLPGTHKGQ